jgi:hypothetical protein
MFGLISLVITGVVAVVGHTMTRDYTASRLRFVDAIQNPGAAWIAGLAAWGVGMLLTPLPFITGLTAIALGAGVGTGVASGARRARGYLPPG